MDNIILGLLLLGSRTIYQLRERINKGLNLMYSSSMGSIQSAIKKLLKLEYITYRETVDNGKYKKIYSITNSGKQYFLKWVNSPVEIQNAKNPELTKIYFMGFANKEKRISAIEKYISQLEEQYETLTIICEEADNIKASTKEEQDIIFYQFATARYGRDFIKFNIEWYKNLLNEIRSQK